MSESNFGYNFFIVILGFCILCVPIIFISLSSAPPPITRFQSSIILNTIQGDSESADLLNQTAMVNGSISYLFEEVSSLEEIGYINNITELILSEEDFMRNVSMDEFNGFSKKVHLFDLEMNITTKPSTFLYAQQKYKEMFGDENGTFISYMYALDEWNSSFELQGGYPNVNQTLQNLYFDFEADIHYMVTIEFFADLEINNTPMTISFSRLLLLNGVGEVFFFLTNENAWVTYD
ncbi:MAG: hypothetical protein ACW96U_06090 [Candidatus Heimdallarchaeaceae archaeon]